MLKKIFCISLGVSVCLLLAGAILVPIAAKVTVDKGLDIFSTYYKENTVTNTLPILEDDVVTIQADNLEITLAPSSTETMWVRYTLFGTQDLKVDFQPGEQGGITLTATLSDGAVQPDSRIKAIMEATDWRGRMVVYLPEGVDYKVVGTPYYIDDYPITRTNESYDAVEVAMAELETETEGDWEDDQEPGYSQFKNSFYRLMQNCPFEFTIRNKEDQIQVSVGRENFKVTDQDGEKTVIIGDGFIEITQDAISLGEEYFDIDDDNIKISAESVTIGRYTFKP